MKKPRIVPIAALVTAASFCFAGSLTPPGPPAPTMRALDGVEPRTPISALPFTIAAPGSYCLTASLTRSAGSVDGIVGIFSITGVLHVAPIDTTGTSTNPWVNFSF